MNITRLNFAQTLPLLQSTLSSAHFISLDLEMSGLINEDIVPDQADSMQLRYSKIRTNVKKYLPLQIGINGLNFEGNNIIARPFNVYIFPIALNRQYEANKFQMNAETMNFLATNNFDFNKLFYEAVPYFNKEKLLASQNKQANVDLMKELKRLKYLNSPDTKAFAKIQMPVIQQWIARNDGSPLQISIKFIKYQAYILLVQKCKERWPNLNAEFDSQVIYKRKTVTFTLSHNAFTPDSSMLLKAPQSINSQQKTFNEVIDNIVALKKPLIVHNGFYDLMHIYYRFIGELPDRWQDYSKDIKKLFPIIYDTKYICNSSPLILDALKFQTNLQHCFTTLSKAQKSQNFSLHKDFEQYSITGEISSHEAGYDALMTGYVFAKSMKLLGKQFKEGEQKFNDSNQLLRNRIPLGNMKIPINFEDTPTDIYTADGNAPIYLNSVLSTSLPEQKLLSYLSKFGPANLVYSSPANTKHCITFMENQDRQKFLKHCLVKNGVGVVQIEGNPFVVVERAQEEERIKNEGRIAQIV